MSTAIPGTSSELLFRIDAGWRVFRAAVRALPAERQGEALRSGWTAKEMLAHVAHWDDTVPGYLRALRAGTPPERGDVDAENARVGAEARELTSSEVAARLDAAHARAVEAVRALGEGEARDRRFVEKVAGARAAETHRLARPDAILDELDTAHRLLRRQVAQLTDEQVVANDSWAVAVVAGNSYGHYLEHAAELGMAE